jgi:hypothetical protein
MALDGSHNSDLALKGAGARYHRISSNKQDFDRQVDAIDRWLESHNLRADWTFGDTGARDLAEERSFLTLPDCRLAVSEAHQ